MPLNRIFKAGFAAGRRRRLKKQAEQAKARGQLERGLRTNTLGAKNPFGNSAGARAHQRIAEAELDAQSGAAARRGKPIGRR